MTLTDTIGWLAAALTLTTFSMRSMLPLRISALAANICFISYGLLSHLYPILVLHALLFPCNLFRLCQLRLILPFQVSGGARQTGQLDVSASTKACPPSDRCPFPNRASGGQTSEPIRDWLIVTNNRCQAATWMLKRHEVATRVARRG